MHGIRKMTDDEFNKFIVLFRRAFMPANDPWDFLESWEEEVVRHEFAAVAYAVQKILVDPRIAERGHPAGFVRNRLPLLIDYAQEFNEQKRRAQEAEDRRREHTKWLAAGNSPSLSIVEAMKKRLAEKLGRANCEPAAGRDQ